MKLNQIDKLAEICYSNDLMQKVLIRMYMLCKNSYEIHDTAYSRPSLKKLKRMVQVMFPIKPVIGSYDFHYATPWF